MDWSSDDCMICCWSLMKAFSSPSPYIAGIVTSGIPLGQWAVSSSLVVCRLAAHDILGRANGFFVERVALGHTCNETNLRRQASSITKQRPI
jgi:hypothetical protein